VSKLLISNVCKLLHIYAGCLYGSMPFFVVLVYSILFVLLFVNETVVLFVGLPYTFLSFYVKCSAVLITIHDKYDHV